MESVGASQQPSPGLDDILAEWKNLTLAEHEKILASDWPAVEELQSRKAELQRTIENLEAALSSSSHISNERKASERKRLKLIAAELLALERRNESILSERIAEADRQLKSSSKTIQSLRHVQKAYGSNRRSFWQAYS